MRGLDMMKKWPWMRDLPTCIWAGRGWAYDANGLRRLSSAGGADAMQGVEVWESVGTGPEEVEGKVEVARGAVERPLGEPGAVPQLAQTPSRIQEAQCGEAEWGAWSPRGTAPCGPGRSGVRSWMPKERSKEKQVGDSPSAPS